MPPSDERRVAAMSRAQLEALVLASARSGAPIAPQVLEPPANAPTPRAPVGKALANADVGLFRWLDNDVMGELLTDHLTAPARLVFTTRVCKAFRALGVWTTLELADGERVRLQRTRDTLWLLPGGFDTRLLGFVRAHASTLTTLSLNLRASPTDPRAVAKVVQAAPKLTALSLSDKKINAFAMKGLAALPNLRKLKRVHLGYHSSTKQDAVKLLSGMTALEELSLDNGLSAESFHAVCQAWRKARGGGALLLERLTIGCHIHTDLRSFVPTMSVACPELRELHLGAYFADLPADVELPPALRKLTLQLRGFDNSSKPMEEADRYEYRNADTAVILKRFLGACPRLEEADIGWHTWAHRPIDWNTKWELEVGDALSAVPATLKALTLRNMNVDGGGMDLGPSLHGLPQPTTLRTLTLSGCGVNQCMLDAMAKVGVVVG